MNSQKGRVGDMLNPSILCVILSSWEYSIVQYGVFFEKETLIKEESFDISAEGNSHEPFEALIETIKDKSRRIASELDGTIEYSILTDDVLSLAEWDIGEMGPPDGASLLQFLAIETHQKRSPQESFDSFSAKTSPPIQPSDRVSGETAKNLVELVKTINSETVAIVMVQEAYRRLEGGDDSLQEAISQEIYNDSTMHTILLHMPLARVLAELQRRKDMFLLAFWAAESIAVTESSLKNVRAEISEIANECMSVKDIYHLTNTPDIF